MGFNTNGRSTYVRESLENVLPKAGIPREKIPDYIQKLLSHLSPHGAILESFFDFPRSARIHARQSGLTFEDAYKAVTSDPLVLLEIHDVLKTQEISLNELSKDPKIGRPKSSREEIPVREAPTRKNAKHLPTNEVIATCALSFKEKHGHLPNMKSTGDLSRDGGLPETAPGWTSVINRLRDERATTLGSIVRLYVADNKKAQAAKAAEPVAPKIPEQPAKGKRGLPLPDNDTIAIAAKAYKARYGYFPTMASSGEQARFGGLPETSPVWSGIIKRLPEERDTTIGKIVKAYDQKQHGPIVIPERAEPESETQEKLKAGRKTIPLPDNDTIARCGKAFKDAHGHLPTPKDSGALSRAGGLPETSPAWSGIVKRLPQERGITIGKLVAEHERALEKKAIDALPIRSARWAFAQAVHNIQGTGKIVIDESMEALFRHKKVSGLADIVGHVKAHQISSATDFLVATGMATIDKRKNLTPAPPEVIAQYARLIAQ